MPAAPRWFTLAPLVLAAAALARDPGAEAATAKLPLLLVVGGLTLVLASAAPLRAPAPALLGLVALLALHGVTLAVVGEPAGWARFGVVLVSVTAAGALLALEELKALQTARAGAALLALGATVLALVERAAGASGVAVQGGQGNPNWLGLVLAVTLPALAQVSRARWKARAKAWWLGPWAVAAALGVLATSLARVGWVALAVGVAVAAVLAARGAPARRRRRLLGAGLATLGALVLVLAWAGASRSAGAALLGRLEVQRVVLEHDPPGLLPKGLGTFSGGFLEAQGRALSSLPVEEAARRFAHAVTAHSDQVEVAYELGVVGWGCWLATLWLMMAGHARARRFPELVASVALVVASFGETTLARPAMGLVLGWLCATAHGVPSPPPSPEGAAPRRLAAALLGVLALLQTREAVLRWRAERAVSRSREVAPLDAIRLLEQATRLDPSRADHLLALGLRCLETQDLASAEVALRRSLALEPSVAGWTALGNVRFLQGASADASDAYARALALHPGAFRAHLNRAVAEGRLGNDEVADRHLSAARRIYPGHAQIGAVEAELMRVRALSPASE